MTQNVIGANVTSCDGLKGQRKLSDGKEEVIALPKEEFTSNSDDQVGKQMEELKKLAMQLKTKASDMYCGPDLGNASCGCSPE